MINTILGNAIISDFNMWVVWLVVFIIAIIVEVLTEEIVSLWFAIASILSFILALFSVVYYIQILAFAITSLMLLFTLRAYFKKKLDVKHIATNLDSSIGKEIILTKDITMDGGEGTFADSDIVWTLRPYNEEAKSLKKGDIAICKEIKGNHLLVSKKEDK